MLIRTFSHIALIFGLLNAPVFTQAEAAVDKYQVQTEYLYKFITWPDSSFSDNESPFIINKSAADELKIKIGSQRLSHAMNVLEETP